MRVIEQRDVVVGYDQNAPRGCPFPRSRDVVGIRFTGREASYTKADTWYPSWSRAGTLYTPYTDGAVHGEWVSSDHAYATSHGRQPGIGVAVIEGDDPLDLRVEDRGHIDAPTGAWGGRYPSANLYLDGRWYVGTYAVRDRGRGLNWDHLGPFVGFFISSDEGATWQEPSTSPDAPLFTDAEADPDAVRLGAPHFVDLGRELEHSPDGYAYVVGHGRSTGTTPPTWISGDAVHLARVRPDPATINDLGAWQFYGGSVSGTPVWVDSPNQAIPLVEWPGRVGNVSVSFVPSVGRYIMCFTDGWPTIAEMDSYLLESTSLTGPWRLVAHLEQFGPQGYFLNLPTKFMAAETPSAWLLYSANFTNHLLDSGFRADPPGARYSMCLAELEFVLKEDTDHAS